MKITIIYDTKSGNTRRMAEAIAEGAGMVEGIDVIVKHVDDAVANDLFSGEEIFFISNPALGLWAGKSKF